MRRTIETYREAVVQLEGYLPGQGMPTDLRHLRRERIEAFIIDLHARRKQPTAINRDRGCQTFFRRSIDEDLISDAPMAKMKPPKVPESRVPDPVRPALARADDARPQRAVG